MCGIFGLILKPQPRISTKKIESVIHKIAILSESRGKDSSGIAFRNHADQTIHVIKGDIPIRDLLKSDEYKSQLKNALFAYDQDQGFAAFGHARLVTNGSQLHEVNNQPVLKDDIILIHNGIIVNVNELWEKNKLLNREFSIDTEIIHSLIRLEMNKSSDIAHCVKSALNQLIGTFSIAAMFQDTNQFLLGTNNGSLYYLTDNENYVVFASEGYFLNQLKKDAAFQAFAKVNEVEQLCSNDGLIISLDDLTIAKFSLIGENKRIEYQKLNQKKSITKHLLDNKISQKEVVIDPSIYINRAKESHLHALLEYNSDAIRNLKRCTKCLLPATFPFIEYDPQGICNYCKNYKKKVLSTNLDDLNALVAPYRRNGTKPDCIVPFSGGRDSTYSLHIIKKELGLKPIAYTYDWGMVTDLARRNIARVCGKLGVENIIVSADIRWKRENIRKNIAAWLKNPDLGMIPLFMAGDKYFFYYCNQVKKKTGIDLNIWGINDLENTNFKTGFAGLPPKFNKKRIYSLTFLNQMKLFGHIASNVLKNPCYINQSILDSLGSFATRYIAPKKDYYHLFDYYKWDENEVNNLIFNTYSWETAIDTKSTWRIGDGTASFYNYIYYTVAGFSENDTFRSNQIREGMLDRETALQLCETDNIPRYETLRWYLEIIGLDFEKVIQVVNQIPKLYNI